MDNARTTSARFDTTPAGFDTTPAGFDTEPAGVTRHLLDFSTAREPRFARVIRERCLLGAQRLGRPARLQRWRKTDSR
jgi:hypothetical protein